MDLISGTDQAKLSFLVSHTLEPNKGEEISQPLHCSLGTQDSGKAQYLHHKDGHIFEDHQKKCTQALKTTNCSVH